MFLNKWTVQLSRPGEIVEKAFDSEEELVAFVRRIEHESTDGARPAISVIDPEGKEKLLVHQTPHPRTSSTGKANRAMCTVCDRCEEFGTASRAGASASRPLRP
jgi:hypothetical protein